jgi:glycosyltransferase involved in cell wall biosynthesis
VKITIHSEPAEGALGGAERSVATLAHALAADHDVEIVHHRPDLSAKKLGMFASLDLRPVRFRHVPWPDTSWSHCTSSNPITRFRAAKAWQAGLSDAADLFVTFTHGVPPFCHANAGILVVLFPVFERQALWPWADAGPTSAWKRTTRRAYYEWEWRQRFDTYETKLSISAFTRHWTKQWWDLDTSVVYPPVDTEMPAVPKRNVILSVGRFATAGLSKRHLDLVTLFRRMRLRHPERWTYRCTGALGDSAADRLYFSRVWHMADPDCHVEANLSRRQLKRAFGAAKLFWHASGLDDGTRPELAEHFGIVTVEAMAAGCVPLVADTGGQREIVRDGIDGWRWSTLEELADMTRRVAADDALRRRMAVEARSRAQAFSSTLFVSRMKSEIEAICTKSRGAPCHSDDRRSMTASP